MYTASPESTDLGATNRSWCLYGALPEEASSVYNIYSYMTHLFVMYFFLFFNIYFYLL